MALLEKKKNKFMPNFDKPSIYSLQLDELKDWLADHSQQGFRAKQIFDWLYVKRVSSFEEMTNLSKELRELLEANFVMTTLKTVVKQESKDGTIKFLLNCRMAIQLKQS